MDFGDVWDREVDRKIGREGEREGGLFSLTLVPDFIGLPRSQQTKRVSFTVA